MARGKNACGIGAADAQEVMCIGVVVHVQPACFMENTQAQARRTHDTLLWSVQPFTRLTCALRRANKSTVSARYIIVIYSRKPQDPCC